MANADDNTLRTLYARALELSNQLEQWAATTADYQLLLTQSLDAFRKCQRLSASLSMFSPNETADDISTGDLQFLNIDFHLAELAGRTPAVGVARKEALSEAQNAYGRYLDCLDNYGLLDTQDKKLLERYHENKDRFEIIASSDPAARRGAKIAQYQQEKELKQKLEYIATQSKTVDAGTDTDFVYRELYLAQLSFNAHKSLKGLDFIAQEIQILSMAPSEAPSHTVPTPETDLRLRQPLNSQYSERLDAPLQSLMNGNAQGPLLDPKGKPMQPFVLHDTRSKLREGVFRSGHRLPTMSIEEYLEAEKARGGIIEGGGEQSGRPKELDDDNIELADKETEKQRAWDDFKEANPKGSGNTLNRG